jgi:putative acetyltransferase
MQPDISISPSDPAHPDAYSLIAQLDNYLMALYPPESNHLLSIADLQHPHIDFLTAIIQNSNVGCGALANHGSYGEIKRMFVLPDYRGLGIGRQLLDALEKVARQRDLAVLRLETGIFQPAALRLYEKAGYHYRDPFGDYGLDPLSVFMEKSLL